MNARAALTVPCSCAVASEPRDPVQNQGSRHLPGREFCADAGVCAAASCCGKPVWEQEIYEHEASGGDGNRNHGC